MAASMAVRMRDSLEYGGSSTEKKHVCATGSCSSPAGRLASLNRVEPHFTGSRDRPHAKRINSDLSAFDIESNTRQNIVIVESFAR